MSSLNIIIPKRSDWFEVDFRRGCGTFLDREQWCEQHCKQRWLPPGYKSAGNMWLFESEEDAIKFWWRWG